MDGNTQQDYKENTCFPEQTRRLTEGIENPGKNSSYIPK